MARREIAQGSGFDSTVNRLGQLDSPSMIQVIEVRPGRWSYMIDGEFPADLYDAAWGLTTYATPEDARRAAQKATTG